MMEDNMNTLTITVEIAGKWEDSLLPVRILSLKDEPYWTTLIPCPFYLYEGLNEGDKAEISGVFFVDSESGLSPCVTVVKKL
jgi:hypothetical protein